MTPTRAVAATVIVLALLTLGLVQIGAGSASRQDLLSECRADLTMAEAQARDALQTARNQTDLQVRMATAMEACAGVIAQEKASLKASLCQ